jgi:hypothetical protein
MPTSVIEITVRTSSRFPGAAFRAGPGANAAVPLAYFSLSLSFPPALFSSRKVRKSAAASSSRTHCS